MRILATTSQSILAFDTDRGTATAAEGLGSLRPTAIARDRFVESRAWCGTTKVGLLVSDVAGRTWRSGGLDGLHVTAIASSPAERDLVWAGTEPSTIWRSDDGGQSWRRLEALETLPSAGEWSFPPKPHTHHVRWIGCHPADAGRLWLAIEAGALVSTADGGKTWSDKVPGGPYDTHALAIHPERPLVLRSAAGDGYYESDDGGATWTSDEDGMDVTYLRSVAIDPGNPDVTVVSAASHPHAAYMAGRSDGRIYRREGASPWSIVTDGWPDPPATVAPLLAAGNAPGELWAADERGVHVSRDGGIGWSLVAPFPEAPSYLYAIAVGPA
jgi:photosystem II stability/assembly factor-like uncharacterized protein